MEESYGLKTIFRGIAAALLLFSALDFGLATPPSFAGQENTEAKVDYTLAQQDILRFEAAINSAVNSVFISSPFAVVQKPKGAYLQGYGVSVAFLVNIHRAIINTPFGKVRTRADMTPSLKKQRIDELKENLIRVLQGNGGAIQQLRKEDSVTIIAYIEDRNIPDEPSGNRTIVLRALKKDLDELGNKSDRLSEFKQRIKIVEY
jgi:hypothetical protein